MQKVLNWCVEMRKGLFLVMCLLVHVVNMIAYFAIGINQMGWLNVFSATFYLVLIALHRFDSEKIVAIAYIEIITYSCLATAIVGISYGYIFFTVGMMGSIFCLAPNLGVMRFVLQAYGMLGSIVIFETGRVGICFSPVVLKNAEQFAEPFCAYNLVVTMFTLVYVSLLYKKHMDKLDETILYNVHHDPLTRLYNRRFFGEKMRLSENEIEAYHICLFDIDNFKYFNDTYGHEAGDKVLTEVARMTEETVGKRDIVVRWGGEEFVILLHDYSDTEAFRKAETLRKKIEDNAVSFHEQELHVTVTIGLAVGGNYHEYEKVINTADALMYQGKKQGKNQVVTFQG